MRHIVLTAFLVFITGTAMAAKVSFGPRGEKAEVTVLATFEAKPGETDHEFFLRKGMFFRGVTESTGFEACAQICRAPDGRPGMVVSTSNAHIGCAIVETCPVGMTLTRESIHSHPTAAVIKLNDNDRAFLEARPGATRVQRYDRRRLDHRKVEFSPVDYAGGPGYLVHGNVLMYQAGEGTARVIGQIPQFKD